MGRKVLNVSRLSWLLALGLYFGAAVPFSAHSGINDSDLFDMPQNHASPKYQYFERLLFQGPHESLSELFWLYRQSPITFYTQTQWLAEFFSLLPNKESQSLWIQALGLYIQHGYDPAAVMNLIDSFQVASKELEPYIRHRLNVFYIQARYKEFDEDESVEIAILTSRLLYNATDLNEAYDFIDFALEQPNCAKQRFCVAIIYAFIIDINRTTTVLSPQQLLIKEAIVQRFQTVQARWNQSDDPIPLELEVARSVGL